LRGRQFELELLAPARALEHATASVAAPLRLGAPPPLDLGDLARRYAVTLVKGELAGGFATGWLGDLQAPSLNGLLVAFAAVALVFTGRYACELFRLVVGINRWVFRVIAYAADARRIPAVPFRRLMPTTGGQR
jgi:hypothetical protein